MVGNEQAKRIVREAFQVKDAATFGTYVMILLDRGYTTTLGARGGVSFKFIGVGAAIAEEARKSIRDQFAPHFRNTSQFCEHGQYRSLCPACSPLR